MDPLTLLRELHGEEPIRRILASGFDSLAKIAAAAPESLSFFAGINEVLARQIIASAEEAVGAPATAGHRSALAGSADAPTHGSEEGDSRPPLKRRAPARVLNPPHIAEPRGRSRSALLDDRPILDAVGLLKTVASGSRPKEAMEKDVLEEVGLTDAEAYFVEGASPWSPAPENENSAAFPADPPRPAVIPPAAQERETEYAPISDWSPEEDPEPVPRLIRAPELGPCPSPREEGDMELKATESRPQIIAPVQFPEPHRAQDAKVSVRKPSFWRFGREGD